MGGAQGIAAVYCIRGSEASVRCSSSSWQACLGSRARKRSVERGGEESSSSCSLTRENQEAIGGKDGFSRCRHAVHGRPSRENPIAIASNDGIDPVVIDVAVENLEPAASKRKPELITVISRLAEACDHEDVTAFSFDPAMESDHARRTMTVKDVDASAPERSKSAPERDQFARITQMIAHCPVAAEIVPPD